MECIDVEIDEWDELDDWEGRGDVRAVHGIATFMRNWIVYKQIREVEFFGTIAGSLPGRNLEGWLSIESKISYSDRNAILRWWSERGYEMRRARREGKIREAIGWGDLP